MIDWPKVILDLNHYMTCRAISRVIGRQMDYAARIVREDIKEPRYSDGVKILELHQKLCGGTHD